MKKNLALILAGILLLTSAGTSAAASGADGEDIFTQGAFISGNADAETYDVLIAEDAGEVPDSGFQDDYAGTVMPAEETSEIMDGEDLSGLIEENASEEEPSGADDAFIQDEDCGIIEGPTQILGDLGPVDNDELFAGYVDSLFGTSGLPELSAAEPEDYGLTGNDLIVYSALRAAAAEIAAGQRESTIVPVPLSDFGCPPGEVYTAEDLGVEDSSDADAMQAAMYAKLDFNYSRVIDVLLADCPYEMYWFDKTKGAPCSYCGISYYSWSTGEIEMFFTGENAVTFMMNVCGEYAGAEEYTVDTQITGAASRAAANAQAVVGANRNKSDLGKLEAYRDYIISHVDYNDDAAGNDSTPFGNPWQLVWVFDNDPGTKVVCEGYSKAFKYLCDCSVFDNPTLKCLLVSGVMQGGTGAGDHMWNLITMGGRSYLADITNTDTGTIGSDGSLFMAGYDSLTGNGYTVGRACYAYDSDMGALYEPDILTIYSRSLYEDVDSSTGLCKGAHIYGEWTTVQPAACNAEGVKETVCTLCGASVTEAIPVSGEHTLTFVRGAEPTCEDPGVSEHWMCSRCGKRFRDENGTDAATEEDLQIPPAGHQLNYVSQVDPTYESSGCIAHWACTVCEKCFLDEDGLQPVSGEELQIEPLNPDWSSPVYTWTEDNYHVTAVRTRLDDEGQTDTETVAASMEVTVQPGCETAGEEVWTSAEFRNTAFKVQTKKVEIKPTGHGLTAVDETEPTCEAPGVRAHWECSRCGKQFGDENGTAEITAEDLRIDPTGHAWGEPVYTWSEDNAEVTAVRTCLNDEEHTETETVAASLEVTVKPGCETVGEGIRKGGAFENEAFEAQTKTVELPAAGHIWDAGVIKVPATEETTGTRILTCTECGYEQTETIDKIHVNISITKNPASSKAKALKKGKVTFTWKKFKQTKKTKSIWKKIEGIEVQYSPDSSFRTGAKIKPVGKKKTSVKITGLSKGTVYYFRLRYKAADGVSAWSKVKKVKVK